MEHQLLVLGDGTLWGVYGRTVNSVMYVHAMLQGAGSFVGSELSGSGSDVSMWAGKNGFTFKTAMASDSMGWTASYGSAPISFTLKKSAAYDYNRLADPAELAGTWTGKTLDGAGTRVTITASGELSGSSSGCEFSGTASPDAGGTGLPQAGGKNVFLVNITTARTSACTYVGGGTWWTRSGQSAKGIAIVYPLPNGDRQLMVGVQNAESPYLAAAFIATNAPSAPPPAVVPIAEPLGLYVGATSSGREIQLLNLENGVIWGVYGRMTSAVREVHGLLRTEGDYFTPTYTMWDMLGRDYRPTGTATKFFVLGFFNTDDFNADIVEGGPGSFTLITRRSRDFDYARPADLNELVGAWTATAADGSVTTVTVSSGGAVSGSSGGCTFEGVATPKSNGRNVFNVSLTFGSAPCVRPGLTAAGFAITYAAGTGRRAMLGVESAARDFGAGFLLGR